MRRSRARSVAMSISAVALALAGCAPGGITGSGPAKPESRSLAPFSRVEIGNGIGLTLLVGAAQSVEVVAQANILPLITTTVEGGVLTIGARDSFTTTVGANVTATVPSLAGISVADGSQASIVGVAADRLDVRIVGGGQVVMSGRATDVTLVAEGGSRADLAGLPALRMIVNLSGGATAALNVSRELSGSASGGAIATIVGGAIVNVEISGGARISGN